MSIAKRQKLPLASRWKRKNFAIVRVNQEKTAEKFKKKWKEKGKWEGGKKRYWVTANS